jgi:sulfatase maturation enzyme AslB (radical SAM superfamily)
MTVNSQLETSDLQPAFHILAKPTGSICNLDCKYCYFLSKEMFYPGSGRKFKRCHGTTLEASKPMRTHCGTPES